MLYCIFSQNKPRIGAFCIIKMTSSILSDVIYKKTEQVAVTLVTDIRHCVPVKAVFVELTFPVSFMNRFRRGGSYKSFEC